MRLTEPLRASPDAGDPLRIILAETHYWESDARVDSHHLAEALALRGHRVLYLSSPLSPFHFFAPRGWRHKWRRLIRYGGCGRLAHPGIRCVVPLTLRPVQAGGADAMSALRASLTWTVPRLKAIAGAAGFGRPDVVCVQSLYYAALPDLFSGAPLIWRKTDDYAAYPRMPRALLDAEPLLAQRADLATVSAAALGDQARAMGAPRVEYFPHGVDFARFARPAGGATPGKRAVFVGSIDDRFDPHMVAAAAGALPDWEFLIAGPVGDVDLETLRLARNVRLTGPIPFRDLPAFLHTARIGLIPYRRTRQVESVHPMKLYEYLAAGLAVVAGRWTEIERIGAPIHLGETPEEFSAAARQAATEEPTPEGAAFARRNSWESRAEQLESWIRELRARL